jgi:hypothetical protein
MKGRAGEAGIPGFTANHGIPGERNDAYILVIQHGYRRPAPQAVTALGWADTAQGGEKRTIRETTKRYERRHTTWREHRTKITQHGTNIAQQSHNMARTSHNNHTTWHEHRTTMARTSHKHHTQFNNLLRFALSAGRCGTRYICLWGGRTTTGLGR